MERDYQAVHAVDLAGVSGVVQKAQGDWPEKKTDLENRLQSVRATVASGRGCLAEERSFAQGGGRERRRQSGLRHAIRVGRYAAYRRGRTSEKDRRFKDAHRPALHLVGQAAGGHGVPTRARTSRSCARCATREGTSHQRRETGSTSARRSIRPWSAISAWAVEHKGVGRYDTESERVAQTGRVRLHGASRTKQSVRALGRLWRQSILGVLRGSMR